MLVLWLSEQHPMSEAGCQNNLKEDVSCSNSATVWFKFEPKGAPRVTPAKACSLWTDSALNVRFNWIWGGTQSVKGAESKRMMGNSLSWDEMLYRKSRTKRRARSSIFFLHCSSNTTSINHLTYSSLDVLKTSFVMLSMVVVEIQTPGLTEKRKKGRIFHSPPPTKAPDNSLTSCCIL